MDIKGPLLPVIPVVKRNALVRIPVLWNNYCIFLCSKLFNMKTLRNIIGVTLAGLMLMAVPFDMQAQSKKKATAEKTAEVKGMVDAQEYVFKAQTVIPMSGRTRQITSDYDLKVTKEEVVAYLPYFGRAYSAPIDPSKGGIQFTSKDFEYTATPRKKGGWEVLIRPKDARDVQQLTLTISENGYGSLQVISTNRQPISFSGYITEKKETKK